MVTQTISRKEKTYLFADPFVEAFGLSLASGSIVQALLLKFGLLASLSFPPLLIVLSGAMIASTLYSIYQYRKNIKMLEALLEEINKLPASTSKKTLAEKPFMRFEKKNGNLSVLVEGIHIKETVPEKSPKKAVLLHTAVVIAALAISLTIGSVMTFGIVAGVAGLMLGFYFLSRHIEKKMRERSELLQERILAVQQKSDENLKTNAPTPTLTAQLTKNPIEKKISDHPEALASKKRKMLPEELLKDLPHIGKSRSCLFSNPVVISGDSKTPSILYERRMSV